MDGEQLAQTTAIDAAAAPRLLDPAATYEILRRYGVPLVPQRVVATGQEAVRAADELGYPVVLKAVAPDLVHKSDAGAVCLNLRSGEEIDAAACDLAARFPGLAGLLVQPLAAPGLE